MQPVPRTAHRRVVHEGRPHLARVRIGDDGKVCLFVREGSHVVADVNGYYSLPTT